MGRRGGKVPSGGECLLATLDGVAEVGEARIQCRRHVVDLGRSVAFGNRERRRGRGTDRSGVVLESGQRTGRPATEQPSHEPGPERSEHPGEEGAPADLANPILHGPERFGELDDGLVADSGHVVHPDGEQAPALVADLDRPQPGGCPRQASPRPAAGRPRPCACSSVPTPVTTRADSITPLSSDTEMRSPTATRIGAESSARSVRRSSTRSRSTRSNWVATTLESTTMASADAPSEARPVRVASFIGPRTRNRHLVPWR